MILERRTERNLGSVKEKERERQITMQRIERVKATVCPKKKDTDRNHEKHAWIK